MSLKNKYTKIHEEKLNLQQSKFNIIIEIFFKENMSKVKLFLWKFLSITLSLSILNSYNQSQHRDTEQSLFA
jgi:hypothetical protein